MTDIVTAASKVAKRLRESDEEPSAAELASVVEESTDGSQTDSSAFKQYAKKAAIFGAIALARRYLADDQRGIDEDATRVEVVDPDEREASKTKSGTESEKSSGGLFSLKRVLLLGALVGAGYMAVKKFRSKGEQHTLKEWDEQSTATESATAGQSSGSSSGETTESGEEPQVDIGAGEADDEGSNTTTDPTEVADGDPVDVDEDESAGGTDDSSAGADPDEVAVEEDGDEDEDERLSQSE